MHASNVYTSKKTSACALDSLPGLLMPSPNGSVSGLASLPIASYPVAVITMQSVWSLQAFFVWNFCLQYFCGSIEGNVGHLIIMKVTNLGEH